MGIGRMGKRRARLHAIQVGRIVGPAGGTGRCRRMIFHHSRKGNHYKRGAGEGCVKVHDFVSELLSFRGSQAEVPAPRLSWVVW
eukprot:383471-Hanusia_phi.AAC.1